MKKALYRNHMESTDGLENCNGQASNSFKRAFQQREVHAGKVSVIMIVPSILCRNGAAVKDAKPEI